MIFFEGNPIILAENRKTRVQRNRQKAHQERLRRTSLLKAKKKFDSQFGRIGVFKKEINKAAQITRKRMRERELKMLDAMYQPRHIGRLKFRPQDVCSFIFILFSLITHRDMWIYKWNSYNENINNGNSIYFEFPVGGEAE